MRYEMVAATWGNDLCAGLGCNTIIYTCILLVLLQTDLHAGFSDWNENVKIVGSWNPYSCVLAPHTRAFSCGEVFESCFVMKHLEVILLKVKHIVSPRFWSGFSPNTAKVSLMASKTEVSYYWLSDENMTACSESCVHVVKPFQILKLQLLETD